MKFIIILLIYLISSHASARAYNELKNLYDSIGNNLFLSDENNSNDIKISEYIGGNEVNIGIFLGYNKDSYGWVQDRVELSLLIEHFTQKCKEVSMDRLCEFSSKAENATFVTLKKNIGNTTYTVDVYSSSLTIWDERNQYNIYQSLHSKKVETQFVNSFYLYDIVFYKGPTFFGGGPNFYPPKTYTSGEINSNYYIHKRPGVKLINQAFEKSVHTKFGIFISSDKSSKLASFLPRNGNITYFLNDMDGNDETSAYFFLNFLNCFISNSSIPELYNFSLESGFYVIH